MEWLEKLFINEAKAALNRHSGPVLQPLTVTENGTYEAPEGVDGYNPVTVDVAASGGDDGSFKAVIERTATEITLPSDLTIIGDYAFYHYYTMTKIFMPDGLEGIRPYAFAQCSKLALDSFPDSVGYIHGYAFEQCLALKSVRLPRNLSVLSYRCFHASGVQEVTFMSKPAVLETAFSNCTNLLTINVPWAEGEVANAPWGATKATINYNYTGG